MLRPKSHAISHTTNLLLTTITSASSYYISHSAPSSHAPSSATRASSTSTNPPPPPPRALVFLTSERTRKGLAGVHAVSGQAVNVSSKTVTLVDNMIRRAMGGKAKEGKRTGLSSSSASMLAPGPGPARTSPRLPPRTPSPSPFAPPAYQSSNSLTLNHNPPLPPRLPPRTLSPSPFAPPAYQSSNSLTLNHNPPLPPRQPSPAPSPYGPASLRPPFPPQTLSAHPDSMNPPMQPRLSTKHRLLLSADLILSTLDHSTRQILDVGTDRLGAVVGHKYVNSNVFPIRFFLTFSLSYLFDFSADMAQTPPKALCSWLALPETYALST